MRIGLSEGPIPFIDVARSIAPLIVLWVHIGVGYGYTIPGYNFVADSLHLLDSGAQVGVFIFFLVSGFIISHVASIEAQPSFAVKRIFRIAPMLFFGVAIAYASSFVLASFGLPPVGPSKSLRDLVLSMFLMDWFFSTPFTLSVTWTLVAEVTFYTMMFLAYRSLDKSPVSATVLLIVATAILTIAAITVFGGSAPATFYVLQVEFILVGRAIYLFCSGRASLLVAIFLGVLAMAVLTGLYTLRPYSMSLLFAKNSVAYSWAVAIVLFCLMAKFVKVCPPPLKVLSNISYSIYMLHYPIGSLVIDVAHTKYGMGIGLSFWLGLGAVLVCSYATYLTIEVRFQALGRLVLGWTSSTPQKKLYRREGELPDT